MRIVLAEDLALLREGLIRIFETYGFEVADAVANGPSLIKALTTHRPDIAVVDVALRDGLALVAGNGRELSGLVARVAAKRQRIGRPVLQVRKVVASRSDSGRTAVPR